jgi:DHA2 family multidrug resistance protein
MQGLLVHNTQVMHASLAAHVNLSDPVVAASLHRSFDTSSVAGLEALNAEVTRQASMVAYVDDFRLMFIAMLVCIPAALLMRPAGKKGDALHVAVE